MSPTWYIWMEQARATSPSSSTLDRLARALRLSPHERAHLFRLARPAEQQPTAVQRTLPAPYDKVLRGLFPHPAYAVNVRWDLLDWNEAATVVLGEFGEPGSQSGNVLARLFLDPSWRSLFVDWDEVVRSAVQQFRAATVGLVDTEELSEFIAELGLASPTFAELWKDPTVQPPAAWRKRLHHPKAGRIAFDYATFRVEAPDGDVTFVVYTPADDACATAVRRLCRGSE